MSTPEQMAKLAVELLEVNLATICIQSALYGVFFVLAVTALVVFVARHRREYARQLHNGPPPPLLGTLAPWRSPLFICTIILLCSVTADWCIVVYRAFQAFVHFQNGTNPVGFFSDIGHPTSQALNIIPTVTVVTCDFMVIYRTWVIWNRRWWVTVLPTLTTTALALCSIMIDVVIARTKSRQSPELQPWLTPAYTLTFINNFYGTGMITYRILSTNRAMRGVTHLPSTMRVQGTLGILIESAALYASWTLFFFITYIKKSIVNGLANDCFPPVSGIALMLITVRVGLGWAHRSDRSAQNQSVSVASSAYSRSVPRVQEALPMHAINLRVSKTVEQETETDYGLPGMGSDRDTNSVKHAHGLAV
ncbi:hypothetical protein C8Q76DRAFT_358344 [Earliella scabrosa]|nr:hypothetical protein C8Q76DRAFT_358344 [Earliella scabrosa]